MGTVNNTNLPSREREKEGIKHTSREWEEDKEMKEWQKKTKEVGENGRSREVDVKGGGDEFFFMNTNESQENEFNIEVVSKL